MMSGETCLATVIIVWHVTLLHTLKWLAVVVWTVVKNVRKGDTVIVYVHEANVTKLVSR